MTCRYHWLVSKRREPDVAPCGHCQQCEAHSPDQPSETPVEWVGVVTSVVCPVPQAEPTEPTRDEVIAGLEDLGVKVDKRWGDKRLLDEYEQARLAAQAV
jgi:hypothetical protein